MHGHPSNVPHHIYKHIQIRLIGNKTKTHAYWLFRIVNFMISRGRRGRKEKRRNALASIIQFISHNIYPIYMTMQSLSLGLRGSLSGAVCNGCLRPVAIADAPGYWLLRANCCVEEVDGADT